MSRYFEIIHRLGRCCLNCESWRSGDSLLCPDCEDRFLDQRNHQSEDIGINGRKRSSFALFDWIPDENRCLSLLVKQLKGGALKTSGNYWGRLLAMQSLKQSQNFSWKKTVLLPAPSKHFGAKDHAYRLSEGISEITGWPILQVLEREPGVDTKLLARSARGRIRMKLHEKITPGTCMIFVDDIVTTGSTAMAAQRAVGVNVSFEIWSLARRRELAASPLF